MVLRTKVHYTVTVLRKSYFILFLANKFVCKKQNKVKLTMSVLSFSMPSVCHSKRFFNFNLNQSDSVSYAPLKFDSITIFSKLWNSQSYAFYSAETNKNVD